MASKTTASTKGFPPKPPEGAFKGISPALLDAKYFFSGNVEVTKDGSINADICIVDPKGRQFVDKKFHPFRPNSDEKCQFIDGRTLAAILLSPKLESLDIWGEDKRFVYEVLKRRMTAQSNLNLTALCILDSVEGIQCLVGLIRRNQLVTVGLGNPIPIWHNNKEKPPSYSGEKELIFTRLDLFDEICSALKATDTLRSFKGFPYGFPAPLHDKLSRNFIDALYENKSIVEVIFTQAGYMKADDNPEAPSTVWFGSEITNSAIIKLLKRNAEMQKMNKAVSVGDSPAGSSWSPSRCPMKLAKSIFLSKFIVPTSLLNPKTDRCFCQKCHKARRDKPWYMRGKPAQKYELPVGWCRIGLVPTFGMAFAQANEVFEKWHVSYHGTTKASGSQIMKGGLLLLKAGDVALGGSKLGVRAGHILKKFKRINKHTRKEELFDPNQIFTSPSIRYSAHPAYAKIFVCASPDDPKVRLGVQFAFQCRQRPGSYSIGQETVGAGATKLDPHFPNSMLEFYTRENPGVVIVGLLMKITVLRK
eukprot:g2541.t1